MSYTLQFDFLVDKEKNQIRVAKTFDAQLGLVWDMWTKSEYLDKWWAPKPYRVETQSMDFYPGGRWFYAMVSPENEKHWCVAKYEAIENHVKYSYTDAFTDETGTAQVAFPNSHWTIQFNAANESDATHVNILLQYASLEDMEKILEMGFKEGFSMCLTNLDEFIQTIVP